MAKLILFRLLIVFSFFICAQAVWAAVIVPPNVLKSLMSGVAVDLIIEYESAAIEQEAAKRRNLTPSRFDNTAILDYKAAQYKTLKQRVDSALPAADITHLKDYSHLPMSFKRVKSMAALNLLAAQAGIKAIYENGLLHPVLAQSLPLVNQPAVAAVGERGKGTTVAVIDDGIDYTNPAFGSCTAPGVPASCHVSVSLLFGTGTTNTSHGSNVSATVLGMAPDSRIVMLNAFSGTSANFADVISAINWTIANQAAYNIASINMSLGDGTLNTVQCGNGNAFVTPVTSAINTGISVVASAGNDTYTNGLGSPACTPGVISVGAVYDANVGGLNWGVCTDLVTAADKIACFSDSASYLTMLAPGALITAAGYTFGGTSQASPHVAGAVAVLRSTFPAETLSQTKARLVNSGIPITDARNNLIKPRLNLLEASRPANDAFLNRSLLNGVSGSANGTSLLATKEAGEPNHAGNVGGASLWFKWIASSAGQVSLDTHGSGFDTLLAVYTGTNIALLTPVVSNDNDGTVGGTSSALFQAKAGTEYEIALDGANGVAGNALLNWSLNTTAKANLSLNLSGPSNLYSGSTVTYTLTIINAGPQTATNVVTTAVLPVGASYVSGPPGCTAIATSITCLSGNIANGGRVSLLINILWNASSTTETLSASVTSDLPDPLPSDSSANIQVVISNNADNDVPTLPWWGQLVLATTLCGIAITTRKRTL